MVVGVVPDMKEPERGFYRALQLCEGRREKACTHPYKGKSKQGCRLH
jgi:hypothetical protein